MRKILRTLRKRNGDYDATAIRLVLKDLNRLMAPVSFAVGQKANIPNLLVERAQAGLNEDDISRLQILKNALENIIVRQPENRLNVS